MICRVCRSESFSQTEGGDYVCEICGTQSQDYANEVVEFESNITSTRHVKTKKKVERKEVELLSYEEGFQMVLQSQIETMITRFGCSENLYQIVGQLWLQFMKKYYEYIYTDNEKSDEVSQVVVDGEEENKDKEQDSVSQSDPVVPNENPAPENAENTNNNAIEGEIVQPHASSDPLNNTNATDKSNIDAEQQLGENNGEAANAESKDEKAPSIKAFLSRNKPKFSLSVCFIYLGCLWCREPIDISDIMRWMRSGELPFVSVANSLPRNIDKISFLKSLQYFPTCPFLADTSKKLAVFLNFSPLPLNPPPFVYRLFQDLSFPPQLYGPTLKLIERSDPLKHLMQDSIHSLLPMRAVLMSYVIVTMKMCLGFDDDWDRDLTPFNKRLAYSLPFSTLREWIDQRMKMLIKSHITHPWNLMELHRMPKDGLQTYLDFCRNQIFSNEDWPTGSREVSDLFEVMGRSTAPRARSPVRRRASFGSQNDVSFDDLDEEGPARKRRKLDNSHANPAKQYTIYKKDKTGEFHRSYHFMLQICARYIDTTVQVLQSAVLAVEQQLLK